MTVNYPIFEEEIFHRKFVRIGLESNLDRNCIDPNWNHLYRQCKKNVLISRKNLNYSLGLVISFSTTIDL